MFIQNRNVYYKNKITDKMYFYYTTSLGEELLEQENIDGEVQLDYIYRRILLVLGWINLPSIGNIILNMKSIQRRMIK